MDELTGFQRDILYCAAAVDDPYGLKIGREMENYASPDIYHGRLYPNLNTLVNKGLLKKEKKDDRSNLYILTPEAKQLIIERRRWEEQKLEEIEIDLN